MPAEWLPEIYKEPLYQAALTLFNNRSPKATTRKRSKSSTFTD
jgi:hypothetical protein